MSASIAALVLCSIKNEPMAATIHSSIKKYRIVVPMPSKNVRKAVKMFNIKLIGNKIIFIIHLIYFSPSLEKGVLIMDLNSFLKLIKPPLLYYFNSFL